MKIKTKWLLLPVIGFAFNLYVGLVTAQPLTTSKVSLWVGYINDVYVAAELHSDDINPKIILRHSDTSCEARVKIVGNRLTIWPSCLLSQQNIRLIEEPGGLNYLKDQKPFWQLAISLHDTLRGGLTYVEGIPLRGITITYIDSEYN